MGWTNWYTRAVTWLDRRRCEEIFLELLREPEYEQDTVRALVQLAKIQNTERQRLLSGPDFRVVWEARSGRQASRFDEDRRRRYANGIKERISTIMEERSKSGNPDSFNGRLKELARGLAVIDGRDSAEFVMEIMMLPSQWDEWTRADAIEALLFSGARMSAEETLMVLNPAIEYALSHFSYEQQTRYLLQRCLCFLPFVGPPSTGIARIKEVIAARRVLDYELREVVQALGHSRSKDAFELLIELSRAGENRFQAFAGEWIEAMADLDIPESKAVLMSFIDPDSQQTDVEQYFEHYNRERLASHIVEIARAESTVRERLYLLCNRELSQSKRMLLAEVIIGLGTHDAAVAGLDLIHDDASPRIPFSLMPFHENVFFEHRPYGTGGAFTRIPRSATEIRRRLFEMVLNDRSRRRSAWSFLGQIESWRLEYGRPNSEPRHPSINSGEPWPPIHLVAEIKP